MSRSFRLAPMSPLIRGLTLILLALPPIFGVWAIISNQPVAFLVFWLLIGLYGATWLGARPSHFEISQDAIQIVFPIWRRWLPMKDIAQVRVLTMAGFQQELGFAIRIGVGGLWGGCGWLWTTRRGFVEFYISTLDDFVLIERSNGSCILISPEYPDRFADAFQTLRTI